MICARCDQPIKPGEKYDTRGVETGSAAAPDLYFHKRSCRPIAAARPRTYPRQDERY